MKFESRKDALFRILTFGFTGLFLAIILERMYAAGAYEFMWTDILLLVVGGFLLWLYFGTAYELTQSELKYKSGPISGKIEIAKIKEIVKGKTLWAGLKPATARNGLIVKYGKYSEVYISPKTNDRFVSEILNLNENIKVTIHSTENTPKQT